MDGLTDRRMNGQMMDRFTNQYFDGHIHKRTSINYIMYIVCTDI